MIGQAVIQDNNLRQKLQNAKLDYMMEYLHKCKTLWGGNNYELLVQPLLSAFLFTATEAVNFYDAFNAWANATTEEDRIPAGLEVFCDENKKFMYEFATSVVPWKLIPKLDEYFKGVNDWQQLYQSFSLFSVEEINRFSTFVYDLSHTSCNNGIDFYFKLGVKIQLLIVILNKHQKAQWNYLFANCS